MRTTKLILGIISLVLCLFIMFQSCAAGVANTLEENGELSGSAGLMTAICMLIGGIVGVVTRNKGKGGSFTAGGFYIMGSLLGFANAGSYTDLYIWSGLCAVFGLIFIIGTIAAKN